MFLTKTKNHVFKKTIDFKYDKLVALNELKQYHHNDSKFFMVEFVTFSYYIRKFKLTFDDFNNHFSKNLCSDIYQVVINNFDINNDRMNYFLILSLKYLLCNSDNLAEFFDINQLVSLAKEPLNTQNKTEILFLISFLIERINNKIDHALFDNLNKLITDLNELNDEVKTFFFNKLESIKANFNYETNIDDNRTNNKSMFNKPKIIRDVKKNQQIVTKAIQSVKSKENQKNSEETEFKLMSLSSLKNCDRNLNSKLVIEVMELFEDPSGDDRSITNSTWDKVLNFYSLITQGELLKADDKDNYLPSRLFGSHFFVTFMGDLTSDLNIKRVYSFFVNRMCAFIFQKVSRKQQLNEKAIDKLMECIMDFESFVTFLLRFVNFSNSNYLDLFVKSIYSNYYYFKKLNSPDIACNFLAHIFQKTTEAKVIKGLILDSTDVKKIDFDRQELQIFIDKEINQVRLDALKAILNCAIRDKTILTRKRLEKIQKFLVNNDCSYEDNNFMSLLMNLVELAESTNQIDYKLIFNAYLKSLSTSNKNIDSILRFFNNQAKDYNRCKELFNDEVIKQLVEQLNDDFPILIKEDLIMIINNYLEHEDLAGLSEDSLLLLSEIILESSGVLLSQNLINSAFYSLLLLSEKSQPFPKSVLNKLLKNFDKNSNLITFILSREILNKPTVYLDNSDDLELISSKLDSRDVVDIDDESKQLKFEDLNQENKSSTSNHVSLLAAKIILKSIQNKIKLNSRTIDNLMLVLNSSSDETHQTKILAAKCFYNLVKYASIDSDNTIQMINFIKSEIYDVSVYMQAAYLSTIVKIAFSNVNLNTIHLTNIHSCYTPTSLKLNEHDFSDEINQNLFRTLLYESRKQQFDDPNIFELFNEILMLNDKRVAQVLDILVAYTKRYTLPHETIKLIENIIDIQEHFDKGLKCLENLIHGGGCSVSTKTVKVIAESLYTSINSRFRYNSVKLLDKLRRCQELPDDVFIKLELALAGYALELGTCDKKLIFSFIESQTDRGLPLPIDTESALEKEISHNQVLSIFYNTTKHKHLINLELLNSLIQQFNQDFARDYLLIRIFENVAKNNQTLPSDLIRAIEMRTDLEDLVLPIFIYLAQKGEKLSIKVNTKLIKRLLNETNLIIKQELLSMLGSLIETNKSNLNLYENEINKIFLNEIESDNLNVQKLCVKAIRVHSNVTKSIDKNLLDKLIQVATSLDCELTVKKEISVLINSIEGNESHKSKIKMANLFYSSNFDMLNQLNGFTDCDGGLLEQNYTQIKRVLDKEAKLHAMALELLQRIKSKTTIPDDLVESLAVLYESSASRQLKDSCFKLLNDINSSGKVLKTRAYLLVNELQIRESQIKTFSNSQLYKELRKEFQLDDRFIQILINSLNLSTNLNESIQNLDDLIEHIVGEDSHYSHNKNFVFLIENCLLKNKAIKTALEYYREIVKDRKYQNVEECIESLVNLSFKQQSFDLSRLIEIIFFIKIHGLSINENCLQFVEKCLENESELVRSLAFKILKKIKTNRFSSWCDQVIETFLNNSGIIIAESNDYLEILEALISVKYIDIDIFKKERSVWIREIFISNIFKHFNAAKSEELEFYKNWLYVEEKFKSNEKSNQILSLIEIKKFTSIEQIIELVSFIPEFNHSDIIHLLTQSNFCTLKKNLFMNKLKSCLKDANSISAVYLNKLVDKLSSSFDCRFIKSFLNCLKSIGNLREFEDIIEFVLKNKIKTRDLNFIKKVELNDFKQLLEAKLLTNHFNECDENTLSTLIELFILLLKKDWTFDQLFSLLKVYNSNKAQNLINLFTIIDKFNLKSSTNCKKLTQILLTNNNYIERLRSFNQLAIENNFQKEGKIKDVNELLDELRTKNSTNQMLLAYIDSRELENDLFKVKGDDLKSVFSFTASCISQWNEKQICLWSKEVKNSFKKSKEFTLSYYESISVIKRANFLISKHTLTDTQILCCLIALKSDLIIKDKLLEVATGEGKSTIVCILAIIYGLQNKKVDVITSSPVLAERDAKSKAKLFKMFNLTCSDNNDRTVYLKGAKSCYTAHIVYGEVSQFQFDILRDNYSKLETLGERKCDLAIIDEVDSMLIDDSSKIARLSSTIAGMDHFQPVYVLIWLRLATMREKFIMFKNKMFYIDGKVNFENSRITLEFVDSADNQLKKITDLENFLENSTDISKVGEIVENIEKYLIKSLANYLEELIEEKVLFIPNNFIEFFEKQKPKWILNAIEALDYQENVHYVVQDGQIKPVDYFSTGIIQSSTNWSDGLHQFLQLKHNLNMTSETYTTNFLSNIGLINKYAKIFGLTGTLGSETARNVLKRVYKVDLINVPQRRQKQYLELEPIVASSEAEWLNEIKSVSILEVQKNRGVLIICETIEHASMINESLKVKLRSKSIKLYTMNNMDQEKNIEKILPGEIIIATNLAGRGTDIYTSEIEETGGLHVIITFMPNNQRVEDQAFGRTARQGKRGTGIMILNRHSLRGGYTHMTKEVKKQRDTIESDLLNNFERKELELIRVKDRLFDKFCLFLNDEIRKDIRQKYNSCFKKTLDLFTNKTPGVYETNVISAIEEQWAMFLYSLDLIELQNADKYCFDLIEQLRKDYKNDSVIKNFYNYTCIAFDILINEWSVRTSPKVQRALTYFNKAIELGEKKTQTNEKSNGFISNLKAKTIDKITTKTTTDSAESINDDFGLGSAYYGQAWCFLVIQENDYKQKALEAFKKSLICLSNEMSVLNSVQVYLEQKQAAFVNSDLYKQLNTKSTILGSYLNSTQSCIDAIKRSLRLIDLTSIQHSAKDNVLENIEFMYDLERDSNKILNSKAKLKNNLTYSLVFNHLTTRDDSGTIDQAIQTIENAYDKNGIILNQVNKTFASNMSKLNVLGENANEKFPLSENYSDICLRLGQIDLERVQKSIFNPNKEFTDLTKEAALSTITEHRFFLNRFVTESYNADLKITSNSSNSINETFTDKQLNDLIKIIESKTDNNLRFDIVVKNSNLNDINNHFKSSCNPSVRINIDFDNLDKKTTISKINSIQFQTINFEMALNKTILTKLISDCQFIESATLCKTEKKSYEKVERIKLLKCIDELKNDLPCYIKFEDLNCRQALKLMENLPNEANTVIAASFKSVNYYPSKLDVGLVDFSFNNLNKVTSKMLINVLRKKNFDFKLEFNNLNENHVNYIIYRANLDQENMEIRKKKSLEDLFLNGSKPLRELSEYFAKGIEYTIDLSEKQFVPWRSVVAVALIGTFQIVFGGVLIATGFGATVGMSLITEGFADIFYAYRAFSTRQFNWTDYIKQKAISMAISAVSMGLSKLKDAGKGLQTLAAEASKETLEQAGTQVIRNGKNIGQTMIQSGQNLKSIALNFVGTKAGEAVVRESLNAGVQYLSNFSFDRIKPKMIESVGWRVKSSFSNTNLMCVLRKMYAIDLANNSKEVQKKIEQIVSDQINPRHDFARRQWDSVCLPLLKGILSSTEKYGSSISMSFRVIGILNGLYQVQTLIDSVVSDLIVKLNQVDKNTLTITLVLHKNLKINKVNSLYIRNKLKEFDIINENDNFNVSNTNLDIEKDELKKKIDNFFASQTSLAENITNEDEIKKTNDFINKFYDEFVNIDLESFSVIIKSVSDLITEQLIRIIDSQLIQPFSTLAVSGITDSLSKSIQNRLVDQNQNSDSHKEDQKKYDDLKNKDNLTSEENEFVKNYGKYRTFAEQINYNAKDYSITYSQCEMIRNSKNNANNNTTSSNNKEVKNAANDVRNGQPASLGEMITSAEKNGVNLKIVDDPNYVKTEEDKNANKEIVCVRPGENNQSGHVLYMNKESKFVDTDPKTYESEYDCFYAAMSKILEKRGVNKSINELRNETADVIQSNESYSNTLKAQNWIQSRNPKEASKLLFKAGLYLEYKSTDDSILKLKLMNKKRVITQEEKDEGVQLVYIGQEGEISYQDENDKCVEIRNPNDPNCLENIVKHFDINGKYKQVIPTIKVEPKDLNQLDESMGLTMKKIRKLGVEGVFKNEVPKVKEYLKESKHHIYPLPEVIKLIPGPEVDEKERIEILENYLNNKHISDPITRITNTGESLLSKPNHGKVIHSSIAWNPNNLVHGIKGEYRASDPADQTNNVDKIDHEILNLQTDEYRNKFSELLISKNLTSFGKLPTTTPVIFENDNDPEKNIAKEYKLPHSNN